MLILAGLLLTMDEDRPVVEDGRLYVDDHGVIVAVQSAAEPAPAGFTDAPTIATPGVISPGLIDLHNHVAFNAIPLWRPPRATGYPTRYSWADAAAYKAQVYLPALAQGLAAGPALLSYAQVKALAGGVTAIQGWPRTTAAWRGQLVRSVDSETFGAGRAGDRVRQSVLPLHGADQYAAVKADLDRGLRFVYHLAEGVAPALIHEYTDLADHGCAQPGLVGIHTTALTGAQYADWAGHGAGSIVWSPLSNLLLYGRTTDVLAARAAGLRVCLGADWSPTGSKSLLGELKVAHLINTSQLGRAFTDADLVAFATRNPADALDWTQRVGRLRAGLLADLVITARRADDPHTSLVLATEADVQLVLIAGRPGYGTPTLMAALHANNLSPVPVDGATRQVALPDTTWTDVVTALRDVQPQHAVTALRDVQDRARLRVIPDLPPGLATADPSLLTEPTVRPEDLADVVIPPVDTLTTDATYWHTLAHMTIPGQQLSQLATYYR